MVRYHASNSPDIKRKNNRVNWKERVRRALFRTKMVFQGMASSDTKCSKIEWQPHTQYSKLTVAFLSPARPSWLLSASWLRVFLVVLVKRCEKYIGLQFQTNASHKVVIKHKENLPLLF